MWIADGWKDYEVIDTSDKEKLERWEDSGSSVVELDGTRTVKIEFENEAVKNDFCPLIPFHSGRIHITKV